MVRSFTKDESGNTALGYGLIVSLVALATLLAIGHVGGLFVETFHSVTPSTEITSPPKRGLDLTDP